MPFTLQRRTFLHLAFVAPFLPKPSIVAFDRANGPDKTAITSLVTVQGMDKLMTVTYFTKDLTVQAGKTLAVFFNGVKVIEGTVQRVEHFVPDSARNVIL